MNEEQIRRYNSALEFSRLEKANGREATDDFLRYIVQSLGRDEALRLLRFLWERFRDRFPAWGRWVVDRLLAKGPPDKEPSEVSKGGAW